MRFMPIDTGPVYVSRQSNKWMRVGPDFESKLELYEGPDSEIASHMESIKELQEPREKFWLQEEFARKEHQLRIEEGRNSAEAVKDVCKQTGKSYIAMPKSFQENPGFLYCSGAPATHRVQGVTG